MELNYRNAVGEQLRRIRSQKQLSQAELAALCQRKGWNITREIIARIEGRARWVADFELMLLAEILKVPVQRLLPPAQTWSAQRQLFLKRYHRSC